MAEQECEPLPSTSKHETVPHFACLRLCFRENYGSSNSIVFNMFLFSSARNVVSCSFVTIFSMTSVIMLEDDNVHGKAF